MFMCKNGGSGKKVFLENVIDYMKRNCMPSSRHVCAHQESYSTLLQWLIMIQPYILALYYENLHITTTAERSTS